MLIVRVPVTVPLVPVTMLMDHVHLVVLMDGQGKPARKLFHKVSVLLYKEPLRKDS